MVINNGQSNPNNKNTKNYRRDEDQFIESIFIINCFIFFYSEHEDLDEEVFYTFILVVLYLQNTLIYERNIFRLSKY